MYRVVFVAALVLTSVAALQYPPDRHHGCIEGSNACVYPIGTSEFQCGSIFDFEVEYHVPLGKKGGYKQIEVTFEIVATHQKHTPAEFFGDVKPQKRTWGLEVYENVLDRKPELYTAYALKWSNVKIDKKYGKGEVIVHVTTGKEYNTVSWHVFPPTKRIAKNVILMIGDGMNINMVSGARMISRGMKDGKYKDVMHMQSYPEFGLVNPAGVDSIITDSANSASTYNSGHKSSVNALGVFVDSNTDDDANLDHPKVETLAEMVKTRLGMAVGVISTAEVQDATPAAVFAHTRRRGDKAEITSQAINGCPECVSTVMPEVLMGGGGRYFLPESSIDGSNMYDNYTAAGYKVTYTKEQMMEEAMKEDTTHLLTVSHYGNMDVWLDRNIYTENLLDPEDSPNPEKVKDVSGQPGLLDMVKSALHVLKRNENGFYLMIEAASIDKSAHPLDTHRLLADTIELDNVAGYLKEWAIEDGDETLLIVTADHGHAWDIYGTVDTEVWKKAGRGCDDDADIANICSNVKCKGKTFKNFLEKDYGQSVRELSLARREAIGTYSGAGYPDYVDADGDGFPDDFDVRTVLAAGAADFPDHTENFRVASTTKRPALFSEDADAYVNNPEDDPDGIFLAGNIGPYGSTAVHSACDVGIYGYGPGADKIIKNQDNTYVFHVMAMALGVGTDGEPDDTPKDEDLIPCMNDGMHCHCGMPTTNETCLSPSGMDGMCTDWEGGCPCRVCLCPLPGHSYVKADSELCEIMEHEKYFPTGKMDKESGLTPCVSTMVSGAA